MADGIVGFSSELAPQGSTLRRREQGVFGRGGGPSGGRKGIWGGRAVEAQGGDDGEHLEHGDARGFGDGVDVVGLIWVEL